MGNFVYTFHSGMPGANQLSAAGAAGSLAAILYQCGVTGFAGGILDSLTRTGTTATATRSAGLNLADGIAGMPHIVKISGSSNGWDGEYLLDAPPGSTTCTFQVSSSLPTPATGTVTLVRAPAGLVRSASASNQEVWRAPDTGTFPGYIMLDDSATDRAGFRLAETPASPVEYATMVGLCPTTAQISGIGLIARKTNGSGSNKPWVLIVWKGGWHLFVDWNGGGFFEWTSCGAKVTRKAGDGYPGWILGNTTLPTGVGGRTAGLAKNPGVETALSTAARATTGQYLQRGHAQTGSAIQSFKAGGMPLTGVLGAGGNASGNAPDGKDDLWGPIGIFDGATLTGADCSGFVPGLWDAPNSASRSNLDVLSSVSGLPGRKILLIKARSSLDIGFGEYTGTLAFDITGAGSGGY